MLLQHVIDTIESVAPLKWQEEWDNSGLQVGDRNADIKAALLTTDVTESVVEEAITLRCNLIISHHPLLFHGLKSITGDTPQERIIATAIREKIAIYSSHTAMDVYLHGVSGKMADMIGVTNYRILQPNPSNPEVGLGVIGQLPTPIPFRDLVVQIKEIFETPFVRFVYSPLPAVQTIALCGGAGADLLEDAIAQGADVFVSADFKYHEMQAAYGRIAVVDLDHWVSEHFTRDVLHELLRTKIPTYISQADHSVIVTS